MLDTRLQRLQAPVKRRQVRTSAVQMSGNQLEQADAGLQGLSSVRCLCVPKLSASLSGHQLPCETLHSTSSSLHRRSQIHDGAGCQSVTGTSTHFETVCLSWSEAAKHGTAQPHLTMMSADLPVKPVHSAQAPGRHSVQCHALPKLP